MPNDSSPPWIDTDRLLAARLEQYPGSSSIDLANNLIAETGLRWWTALGIVEDYTCRKVIDTRTADWEAVRPILSLYLRAFIRLAALISVGHLTALFLPPPMRSLVRVTGFLLGAAMVVAALARKPAGGPKP